MSTNYLDLDKLNLEFKHIISGPAPVGRILNYTILIGKGLLKHKNGYRNLDLSGHIGSAWATEFMIGLGIATYDRAGENSVVALELTNNGKLLFDSIKDLGIDFDEGSNINACREQLMKLSIESYNLFKKVFSESAVFVSLELFIKEHKTSAYPSQTFYDDYFEYFLNIYDKGKKYNRHAKTTTGKNRVPSLVQICEFFMLVERTSTSFVFDLSSVIEGQRASIIEVTKDMVIEIEKEEKSVIAFIDDLEKKFGIDGTELKTMTLRNSRLQKVFRDNLFVCFSGKCVICGKTVTETLIASHIKPSSKCNVYEKIDYENGLLLCANHDKLFDNYLITFDHESGQLVTSRVLDDILSEYQLPNKFALSSKYMTPQRRAFLDYHNVEFKSRSFVGGNLSK